MSDQHKTTRRGFLTGAAGFAALGAATAATGNTVVVNSVDKARPGGSKPVRVIFLVSDGMSQAVPGMAEQLSRLVRRKPTVWANLLRDPNAARGFFETHSLNSIVTDSAAAATAWGTGSRVANGAICMLPDGTRLTPILQSLKDAGYGTGLVTTATVTHATPAGFAAVQSNRGAEDQIAPQYRGVVDVVMGGGLRNFDPSMRRSDKTDVLAMYREAGYAVVTDRDGALAIPGDTDKALGLFWNGHLPYTIDRDNDAKIAAQVPTLAEMTTKALEMLHHHEKGFFLQVEGARVDHAAHANDAPSMIWDQIAFDDAVQAALDYQRENPDTLIVVTSDHGNANPGINGIGGGYLGTNDAFARIAQAKGSCYIVGDKLRAAGGKLDAETAGAAVKEVLGIDLDTSEAQLLADIHRAPDEFVELNAQHRGFFNMMAQIVGNHNSVGWSGSSHTEDWVLISAVGPHQDMFDGLLKNTDFYGRMESVFRHGHENPSLPETYKEQFMAKAEPVDIDNPVPHWA